jgi:hypothetical protein
MLVVVVRFPCFSPSPTLANRLQTTTTMSAQELSQCSEMLLAKMKSTLRSFGFIVKRPTPGDYVYNFAIRAQLYRGNTGIVNPLADDFFTDKINKIFEEEKPEAKNCKYAWTSVMEEFINTEGQFSVYTCVSFY